MARQKHPETLDEAKDVALGITARRKVLGWSKSELARRASLNNSTVSLIENNKMVPYPVQLFKIRKALAKGEEQLKQV